MNFGGIPEEFSNYGNSKVAILPVPYDVSSTWIKGADKGPYAILEASENMELFDIETNFEIYRKGIFTDKMLEGHSSIEKTVVEIENTLIQYIDDGKFPVTIGGNHTVSIGAFRAFSKKFSDLTIVQLDAHADLRPEYEGTALNHACVMARAKELCSVVQIGIRSLSVEESDFYDPDRMFFAHKILSDSSWKEKALDLMSKNVYLTIDLDVFDPSIMPSTGTPEPGGLFYYDVLNFIKSIMINNNLVGFDVVELCPNKINKSPDFMAAKLIYQILSNRFKK
ncbi:MAG: agmatinase [Bacteroidota bacterium]